MDNPQQTTELTAGIAWWNSLSHAERRAALDEAGGNASPADAYRWWLRHTAAIAKAGGVVKDK